MKEALMKSLGKFGENSRPKILFFLTDGEPTDAQWPEIHKMFEAENEKVKSIVFSFAIGSGMVWRTVLNEPLGYFRVCDLTKKGAPYEEFEKISLQTGGVARQLYTDSDTAQQLSGFYSEMAIPVIHNFECSYKNTQKGRTICSDSTLFRGQELFSIGEIKNCRTKPKLKVNENNVLADSEILGRFHSKDNTKQFKSNIKP